MRPEMTSLIENWFDDHDDGDFGRAAYGAELWIQQPPRDSLRVIYTTKTGWLCRLEQSELLLPLGVAGKYGLPTRRDFNRLTEAFAGREVLFLGDLDPPDLMIFAWIRRRLSPAAVVHVGISDLLLNHLGAEIP